MIQSGPARHLNFTHAAAELFVTQSAVSRQIKTLEEQLGKKLFVRANRQLSLTDAGLSLQQAVAQAQDVLYEALDCVRPQPRPATWWWRWRNLSPRWPWRLPWAACGWGIHFMRYDQVISAAVNGCGVMLGRLPLLAGLLREGLLTLPWADCAIRTGAWYATIDAQQREGDAAHAFVEQVRAQLDGVQRASR